MNKKVITIFLLVILLTSCGSKKIYYSYGFFIENQVSSISTKGKCINFYGGNTNHWSYTSRVLVGTQCYKTENKMKDDLDWIRKQMVYYDN